MPNIDVFHFIIQHWEFYVRYYLNNEETTEFNKKSSTPFRGPGG
jgi:hypothetical protein